MLRPGALVVENARGQPQSFGKVFTRYGLTSTAASLTGYGDFGDCRHLRLPSRATVGAYLHRGRIGIEIRSVSATHLSGPHCRSWPNGGAGEATSARKILAATEIVASIPAAKAAGVALGRMKNVHARLTVDAMVIATAALADAAVITGDPRDFDRLAPHFPGVAVLSA